MEDFSRFSAENDDISSSPSSESSLESSPSTPSSPGTRSTEHQKKSHIEDSPKSSRQKSSDTMWGSGQTGFGGGQSYNQGQSGGQYQELGQPRGQFSNQSGQFQDHFSGPSGFQPNPGIYRNNVYKKSDIILIFRRRKTIYLFKVSVSLVQIYHIGLGSNNLQVLNNIQLYCKVLYYVLY